MESTLAAPWYPVDAVLPELLETFREKQSVVLTAPPGAGKTTRVPPALLAADWMNGMKMVMLEPRRLAARRAAEFMSRQLHEDAGETVGYRIRGDSRVGSRTRIEVVTEGVLTRMLHDDPALPGVGLVVFDEFHERSIHADLGLALVLDVREHLRSDLRILVMSATLAGVNVAPLLGDARLIEAAGRVYPVETRYLASPPVEPIERETARVVLRSVRADAGDILVFLPGQREIRRVREIMEESSPPEGIELHALYGDAGWEQQQAALNPSASGKRKVILSTSVAETSLTIDGVRVVIDAGLSRRSEFDPGRGMSGLATYVSSKATADQRRGRAGRQAPGVCYRLWTERQHRDRQEQSAPEIAHADLAPLALDLARWGDPDGRGLRLLDPPPPSHLSQARTLLADLGVAGGDGRLTPHGLAIVSLPVHPRLGHMILRAKDFGMGPLACDIAALLQEREPRQGGPALEVDLARHLAGRHDGRTADPGSRAGLMEESRRLRRAAGIVDRQSDAGDPGLLVAFAYPERIAQRRPEGGGRFLMRSGTGARVPERSALSREEFLAVAGVDGAGKEVRVFLAAAIQRSLLVDAFSDQFEVREEVVWSMEKESVVSHRTLALGAILLERHPFEPGAEVLRNTVLQGIQQTGIGSLPWDDDVSSLRVRSEWLRISRLVPDNWPNLSDEALLATLGEWLAPALAGIRSRSQFHRIDLASSLKSLLTVTRVKELEKLAPQALAVPTGSKIHLRYSADGPPVLAVRLQEMFGERETPRIAGGRVEVVVHLLSPAGRPLAITRDLPSFWRNAYPSLRSQMRSRYPKHYWPEDPLSAAPTRRAGRGLRGGPGR